MATYQVSHNDERSIQLNEIMERRKDLPRNPEKAAIFLLFEYYDKILGVKRG